MEEFNVNGLDQDARKDIKEILHELIKYGLLMPDPNPEFCKISTDFLNILEEMGGGKRNERTETVDQNIPRFTSAP